MENVVVLDGGYGVVFMCYGQHVYNIHVFSRSVLDCIVKDHEKVLQMPYYLAVSCSLHKVEPGFVIC